MSKITEAPIGRMVNLFGDHERVLIVKLLEAYAAYNVGGTENAQKVLNAAVEAGELVYCDDPEFVRRPS